MTAKQAERLTKQIADIKRILAAEKRKFGAYDDSYGRRYSPTALYVQLGDYAGGLRYTKWFEKNFPDDIGYPDFLFEWLLILFQNGKLRDAERMAFRVFCSNTYLIDKFFERPIIPLAKWEGSNLEAPAIVATLGYSASQPELHGFAEWLASHLKTEKFTSLSAQFRAIQQALLTERDSSRRRSLLAAARQLEDAA